MIRKDLTGILLAFTLAAPTIGAANEPNFPPLDVPARKIPVPTTVSPEMQKMIATPVLGLKFWMEPPTTPDGWRALRDALAEGGKKNLPEVRQRLGVTLETQTIGGVNCYVLTPDSIPEANRNRLLMYLHGGARIIGLGESGTGEATIMAGRGHFKVISVDYRMLPDFPFPADLDDVIAVWKEVVKMVNPANTAIFGTSTGGALTLTTVLRAKQEGLPMPGAIALGTPNSDFTWTGDTLFTNELIDNVFPTFHGFADGAARMYASGRDLKEPLISPIYGDFHGFPPAILTTGTRDLLLSDTVRVHRKLRQAGVEAQLQVFEGQSHAQYLFGPSPEGREVFAEVAAFFDAHLGR
jgi:epsilon-lactone hydrolase